MKCIIDVSDWLSAVGLSPTHASDHRNDTEMRSHAHTCTQEHKVKHTRKQIHTHLTAAEHLWYGKLVHVNLVGRMWFLPEHGSVIQMMVTTDWGLVDLLGGWVVVIVYVAVCGSTLRWADFFLITTNVIYIISMHLNTGLPQLLQRYTCLKVGALGLSFSPTYCKFWRWTAINQVSQLTVQTFAESVCIQCVYCMWQLRITDVQTCKHSGGSCYILLLFTLFLFCTLKWGMQLRTWYRPLF